MKPLNLHEYEALAQARLETSTWDFYQGGSDDEITLQANRSAFARIWLRPRILVDVSTCHIETTVINDTVSMPILIAPTSLHRLAHPEGECATARGAGMAKTLMIVSTVSTYSLEEIAQNATGPLWFQLYTYGGFEETLVKRAETAGYRAIVLTVDQPSLGRRERDIRNNFHTPPHLRKANFDQAMKEQGASLTWDFIPRLRDITSLPILLKGIMTAEDALLAIHAGIDGIIVSNHGGRQLDGTLPSIEALPEIVDAVAGRCEVYLDGGIRRGTDILKALALGARAVLIGRPILWGLTLNGAQGVCDVLELLREELKLAMMLSGSSTLASVNRHLVLMKSV